MMHHDVIIIGGGPAGLACAIQLKRQGNDFIIFEKERLGGLLWNANLVENYPGFPNGIKGIDLVKKISEQAMNTGVIPIIDRVLTADWDDQKFIVETQNSIYSSNYLVLASGTIAVEPVLNNINLLPEKRIHSDILRLLDVHNQNIAIVGAGDAAFDYALTLSKHNKISINNRNKKISALPLLVDRINAKRNVIYRDFCEIELVEKSPRNGLEVTWKTSNNYFKEELDHLIFAIGRKPDESCMAEGLKKRMKHLEKECHCFRIGDLVNGNTRQVSIAVGDGVLCAMRLNGIIKK